MQKSEAQKQLEREVKKNLRRIKRFIKSAEKRGYTFSESAIPSLPKKITEKTLQRFEAIRPQQLYKKSVYVSPTGTKVKGTKRRTEERSISAKKAAETRKRFYEERKYKYDTTPDESFYIDSSGEYFIDYAPDVTTLVLDTVKSMIDNWTPDSRWSKELAKLKEHDVNILRNILNSAIAELGERQVALNCENHAEEIITIANQVLYESGNSFKQTGRDGMQVQIQRFAAIIRGKPLTVSESIELTSLAEEYQDVEV